MLLAVSQDGPSKLRKQGAVKMVKTISEQRAAQLAKGPSKAERREVRRKANGAKRKAFWAPYEGDNFGRPFYMAPYGETWLGESNGRR